MDMDTLEEWLEVQGRLLNSFDTKYGFQRLDMLPNGDIIFNFDMCVFTADRIYFTVITIDELPYLVDAIEQDIKRF